MSGQDGERVDEQFISLVDNLFHLFFRTVSLAEEARPLFESLCVDLCSGRSDACGVPLYGE